MRISDWSSDVCSSDLPTTALDVTIQAQILELMADLRRDFDTAIILITHDLGVVAGLCDRVMVMYAGRVVEKGAVRDIFYRPQHPYTLGLLRSMPRIDEHRSEEHTSELQSLMRISYAVFCLQQKNIL